MAMMRMASASIRGSINGHKDLQQLIAAETNAKEAWKTWLQAQNEVCKCLMRWAESQNGRVQARIAAIARLQMLLLEKERSLATSMKQRREVYSSILGKERICDTFRKDRQKLQRQLSGAQRELRRQSRRTTDVAPLESKVRQIEDRISLTMRQLGRLEAELQAMIDARTREIFVLYVNVENDVLRLRASVNECIKTLVLSDDTSFYDTGELLIRQTQLSDDRPTPSSWSLDMSLSSSTPTHARTSTQAPTHPPPPYSEM
eukprot:m.100841 g.100841  ORF g.100841 m.100841 type:complete len:260 (-) comp14953_c2_seq4:398-1177(-)